MKKLFTYLKIPLEWWFWRNILQNLFCARKMFNERYITFYHRFFGKLKSESVKNKIIQRLNAISFNLITGSVCNRWVPKSTYLTIFKGTFLGYIQCIFLISHKFSILSREISESSFNVNQIIQSFNFQVRLTKFNRCFPFKLQHFGLHDTTPKIARLSNS